MAYYDEEREDERRERIVAKTWRCGYCPHPCLVSTELLEAEPTSPQFCPFDGSEITAPFGWEDVFAKSSRTNFGPEKEKKFIPKNEKTMTASEINEMFNMIKNVINNYLEDKGDN